jgi:hypothetical protein
MHATVVWVQLRALRRQGRLTWTAASFLHMNDRIGVCACLGKAEKGESIGPSEPTAGCAALGHLVRSGGGGAALVHVAGGQSRSGLNICPGFGIVWHEAGQSLVGFRARDVLCIIALPVSSLSKDRPADFLACRCRVLDAPPPTCVQFCYCLTPLGLCLSVLAG